eukprot:2699675-Amphidinium_carterae.1
MTRSLVPESLLLAFKLRRICETVPRRWNRHCRASAAGTAPFRSSGAVVAFKALQAAKDNHEAVLDNVVTFSLPP